MVKRNSFVFAILVILISSIVIASDDAPPAVPSEYWGTVTLNGVLAPNGLTVEAFVNGLNYAQASSTFGGYYDILLAGGDRELTYNDDRDCSIHWGNLEACVPCIDEADCIEGPQDDADVLIKVNSLGAMPYIDWLEGFNEVIEIVNPIGDWDISGCVNMIDFTEFADYYGQTCTPMLSEICDLYDIERDYTINMLDFTIFADHYGEGC